ncbi:hypothetical protein CYY_002976 [Polysphondylium violaceum]|uniref:Uncharacterized protein n=1 Tax=Polysphondylium violaceum TaxID=133409 RepID=A0A8J4V1R9_9MYCE|nr:hypothetical protein CYY_002976 [Polysphondylium violaceum]
MLFKSREKELEESLREKDVLIRDLTNTLTCKAKRQRLKKEIIELKSLLATQETQVQQWQKESKRKNKENKSAVKEIRAKENNRILQLQSQLLDANKEKEEIRVKENNRVLQLQSQLDKLNKDKQDIRVKDTIILELESQLEKSNRENRDIRSILNSRDTTIQDQLNQIAKLEKQCRETGKEKDQIDSNYRQSKIREQEGKKNKRKRNWKEYGMKSKITLKHIFLVQM